MINFKRLWKSIRKLASPYVQIASQSHESRKVNLVFLKKSSNFSRKIKEINYKDVNLNEYIIIDVRSRREFKETHLNKAINIPLPDVKRNIGKYISDKDKKILVYCEYGARSARAVELLDSMGYTQVYNLKGGLENI